jgi:hypothetical protein
VIKLLAEVFEVVRFAVVYDPVAGFWIMHWLMPGVGGVDDGKTRVTEDHFATVERAACDTLIVRAAMTLRVIHAHYRIPRC